MAWKMDEKLTGRFHRARKQFVAARCSLQRLCKLAIARRRSHSYEPLAGNIAIRRTLPIVTRGCEQVLATILIVDIVRSTEKVARLGDSRWTQVMNHYYAAVRRELKTLRGKEVVTTGDGLLATFDAPPAAVRCATAIREAVRTLGLEIRVGLHVGEYNVSGPDVFGLALHIGAQSRRESARR